MNSHSDGRAKLKVKPGVQISDLKKTKFKFDIAAYDCGSPTLHSKKLVSGIPVRQPLFPVTQ